jgi:hypothetical protein
MRNVNLFFFCLMKREIGGRMRRGKNKGEQNVG